MRLKKFQRVAIKKLNRFCGRALLADDMGCGKTITAWAWKEQHPNIDKVLLFCPSLAKWHWKNEIWKHFGVKSVLLEGRTPDDEFLDRPLTIINYDIAPNWRWVLAKKGFDLAIIDECHYVSNPETKRFKAIKTIIEEGDIPYRIGLSGTPLTNRHAELWPILNLIRPDKYPSRFQFGLSFCSPRKERGKWIYKGSINGKALHEELKSTLMIRRNKSEVLDLPPKTRYVIPLDIDNREEYDLAVNDFRKWLKNYNPYAANFRQKSDARVQLGYLIRIASKGKLANVRAWVHNFFADTEQKLIVFGVNRNILENLESKFHRCCVLVNGTVTGKARQDRMDRFNEDPKCRLFLGNIRAAGTNWSSKQCWNVAFAQLAWSPGLHTQGEDRCYGMYRGGGNPVSSYFLVAHGTVEEEMCELLQKKASVIDTVLDNGKVAQEFDVFDKLMENLTRKWND